MTLYMGRGHASLTLTEMCIHQKHSVLFVRWKREDHLLSLLSPLACI